MFFFLPYFNGLPDHLVGHSVTLHHYISPDCIPDISPAWLVSFPFFLLMKSFETLSFDTGKALETRLRAWRAEGRDV